MTELLPPGTAVELVSPLPGYEAGARGFVVRSAPGGDVLVRFEETGHATYVPQAGIRVVDPRSTG